MSSLPKTSSAADSFLTPEFHTVAESLTEGVLISDEHGLVCFLNSRMAEIVGYQKSEILGRRVYEFIFPQGTSEQEEQARLMEERYRARKQGVSEKYELSIVRKDGTRRWIDIKAGPLFDRSGRIFGSVSTVEDITEKKQLEEQLRWSQKLEAVGRLAGGVAHDFNNLLTVIQGYADLLRQQLDPEDPQVRKVDVIREASEAASALTQQLLSISRRQVVQMRPISVTDVVEKSLRVIQGMIGERIELIVDLASNLPLICGDAGQVQQVLLNLVVNARDAMPEGGKLLIETAFVDGSGSVIQSDRYAGTDVFIRLRVEDTGHGMTEDVKAHAFEPFFTTKKNGLGSGLGLSVSYGIAEEHRAEIRVASEPEQGATIDVYFPAISASAADIEAAKAWRGLTGTETVLIVEDHIAVRVLLRETLQRFGYAVLEADDGKEALELVRRRPDQRIDLLVTDVIMPRVNGLELAREIRALKPDIKIVLISGYADDPTLIHKSRSLGYTFLAKPFNQETLARLVRSVLDDEGAAQAAL